MNVGRVTSLALKSLHAALVSQWMEILYIPVEILNKMALWLSEQQNDEGAFVETSEHYYDRSFWVNWFWRLSLRHCNSSRVTFKLIKLK